MPFLSTQLPIAVVSDASSSAFIFAQRSGVEEDQLVVELLRVGEGARVIDQDDIPLLIEQPVPEVGIDVADEVVEHLRLRHVLHEIGDVPAAGP